MEKKLIVSSTDTDVWALAQILNSEQIKDLLSCLQMQEKIKNVEYEFVD
jgi:hypothetical protein